MNTPMPDLPRASYYEGHAYSADQMQAYARAAIEAATKQGKRQPQWLPIETAPKDAYILLWIDIVIGHPLVVQGCWFHDDDADEIGWIDLNGKVFLYATHWMPLPSPPQGKI